MSRDWFQRLGMFDSGLQIWGVENLGKTTWLTDNPDCMFNVTQILKDTVLKVCHIGLVKIIH